MFKFGLTTIKIRNTWKGWQSHPVVYWIAKVCKRGQGKESGSDDESITSSRKRQCNCIKEWSAPVKEQQHHGADCSAVQYTLWAEMLVCETHHSLDNPAEVPMFGVKTVCGKSTTCSSDLNATLTGMANSIVTALFPQMPVCLVALALILTHPVRMLSYVASTCSNSESL